MKTNQLSCKKKTFTFLDHFSIILLVLITFASFLVVFQHIGNINPRWRLLEHNDVISQSYQDQKCPVLIGLIEDAGNDICGPVV